MPDDDKDVLRQSGLNTAWFKRYECMCKKYSTTGRQSNPKAQENAEPLLDEHPIVRDARQQSIGKRSPSKRSPKLPSISPGPSPVPGSKDEPKRKRRPKVQARQGPAYVQPARLRTMEARLCQKVTATADPYNPEVRGIAQKMKMSAKRVEELHRVFLDASKGRKSLDLAAFCKLMASLGQDDKGINDRMFEIFDKTRDKKMSFAVFCEAALLFKDGDRAEQAGVLFKIIDVSDDRLLSKFELLKFFCGSMKDRGRKRAMSDVVNELMFMIDEDNSGEVDYDEFVEKVSSSDDVWVMFDAISPFAKMKERLNSFKFEPVHDFEGV